PNTPQDGKIGPSGLTLALTKITVNEQPGTTEMTITETTTTGTGTTNVGVLTYPLAKFPAQFDVGQLIATPPSIQQGQDTMLSWNGSGGATYELQYVDADGNTVTITETMGGQPLPPTGSYTISNLQATTTFTLIVSVTLPGQDAPATFQRQATVSVAIHPVKIISFTANPPLVYGENNGVPVTLAWDAPFANQFLLNNNIVTGTSATVPVNNQTTFTLEATGYNGPVYESLTVPVEDINLKVWVDEGNIHCSFGANAGSYGINFTISLVSGNTTTVVTTESLISLGQPLVIRVGMSGDRFPQGMTVSNVAVQVSGFPSGAITATYSP
ncbi:MAG TPA: hypothetical protein VF717_15035, partial [Pyrinomonadaceae bacterium]